MRNSLEILDEIKIILTDNNLIAERQELDDAILGSSTGGELCGRSGYTLLTLQKRNEQVKNSVGHLIKEFILFCNANNIYLNEI
jgi:hypothetical protein